MQTEWVLGSIQFKVLKALNCKIIVRQGARHEHR